MGPIDSKRSVKTASGWLFFSFHVENGFRETFKIYTVVHLLDVFEGQMTAAESEDYVTCPSCRALVPWTPICIYCGYSLPPKRKTPEVEEAAPTGQPPPKRLGVTDVSVEPESRLTGFLLWRVRLMELLRARRVSQEVFQQLYKEYLSTTLEAVERKKAFMKEHAYVFAQVEDIRRRLGEMDRRRAAGEQATGEFLDEYSRLKSELDQLQADLSRIRFQQRSLGLVLGEGRDAEILADIEKRFRNYLSYLPLMVGDGLLPPAMEEMVRGDLKEMLVLMEAAGDEAAEVLVEEVEEVAAELLIDDEALLKEVTSVVKGHDDEIRRLIRAIRMKDNALILGPHGEGKTELLLQLQRRLGGIYFHCNEEVSERELVAGFNPSAFVGRNPIHLGCLMQIATGTAKGAPIAFIDAVMKLRPKTQVILFEAMNNKSFTNPVDGKLYFLPEEFSVVAASNLESVVQETPDAAFLDRFGKIILWDTTPDAAVRELLDPYGLPESVVNFLVWVKREVGRMRYLVPISVRNLVKFAQEYNMYRDVYESREELLKLAVDRMLKMRVVNVFGLREFEEAKAKIERYVWE